MCDADNECESDYCCKKDKCDSNKERGTVCITKPGSDSGSNKTLIAVLAALGSILFVALVSLGIMYYKRHK